MRQPRLAEMVADVLRRRILDGTLADGDLLPKQEDLLDEFGVSKPSIREALRILETEGLITVRRGNIGGATVHVPRAQSAAYMLGLVMQAQAVSVADLGSALSFLEPVCAALCAAREDRMDTVVPALRAIHDEAESVIDDELVLLDVGRRFHEALVSLCGNQTIILMVGTLESLWSAHERSWAGTVRPEALPDARYRRTGHKAHERIIALIERGAVDEVAKATRLHVTGAQEYALHAGGTIDVAPLSRPGFDRSTSLR
jgi:DNA-binding FadR family transcriptional regulator